MTHMVQEEDHLLEVIFYALHAYYGACNPSPTLHVLILTTENLNIMLKNV